MQRAFYSAVVLVLVVFAWSAQQPTQAQNANLPQQRPAWEYERLEIHGGHFDPAAANALGAKGWELVTTFTPPNRTSVSICIFKRRR